MRILIVTNLYPPQELGGYGRSMADFAWGLIQLGHSVSVLASDAPYLQVDPCFDPGFGPSGEQVNRSLKLKGSYKDGFNIIAEPGICFAIDRFNQSLIETVMRKSWDGIVVGNIDCLGPELLAFLLQAGLPVVHHIGFMDPPLSREDWPSSNRYILAAASRAVRDNLFQYGLPVANAPVIYPGVRCELFGDINKPLTPALRYAQSLHYAGISLGSPANP